MTKTLRAGSINEDGTGRRFLGVVEMDAMYNGEQYANEAREDSKSMGAVTNDTEWANNRQ